MGPHLVRLAQGPLVPDRAMARSLTSPQAAVVRLSPTAQRHFRPDRDHTSPLQGRRNRAGTVERGAACLQALILLFDVRDLNTEMGNAMLANRALLRAGFGARRR